MSQGLASYEAEFDHLAELSGHLADKVVQQQVSEPAWAEARHRIIGCQSPSPCRDKIVRYGLAQGGCRDSHQAASRCQTDAAPSISVTRPSPIASIASSVGFPARLREWL